MIVYPVKWYQEVFGFNVINGPVEIVVDDSPLGVILKDIHGPNLNKMRIEELCKKIQKVEANSVVKYGILFQIKDIK
jgi:hypothetical protein